MAYLLSLSFGMVYLWHGIEHLVHIWDGAYGIFITQIRKFFVFIPLDKLCSEWYPSGSLWKKVRRLEESPLAPPVALVTNSSYVNTPNQKVLIECTTPPNKRFFEIHLVSANFEIKNKCLEEKKCHLKRKMIALLPELHPENLSPSPWILFLPGHYFWWHFIFSCFSKLPFVAFLSWQCSRWNAFERD